MATKKKTTKGEDLFEPESFDKIDLSKFVENPDNPQTVTDEAFDRLVEKIKANPNGLRAHRIAFVTDHPAGERVVISGNKRLRALKKIHGENGRVYADWFQNVTWMTLEQRKAFIVAANVNEGEWDVAKLLEQYDRDELGGLMDAGELDNLLADLEQGAAAGEVKAESSKGEATVPSSGKTEDDDAPEVKKEDPPKSARGGVYVLGSHRVMCGDSASADDVRKLMNGERSDMLFTDPPYGVAIGDKNAVLASKLGNIGSITKNIMNDDIPSDKLYPILVSAMTNARENSKSDASYFVTAPQGGDLGLMMMMMMKDAGLPVRHMLIWEKNCATFSLGRLDYDYQHEPILYTWTEKHHNYRKGEYRTTIWKYNKPRKCDLHPTMKPVELVMNCLQDATKEGDIVLDMFGGSGTTVIASEKLKRRARLMELDPHYVDVIRRRWAEFVHGPGCDWISLTPEVTK